MTVVGETRRAGWRSVAPGTARGHDVYGAIDLGTNNCRLLVARAMAEGFRVIDAYSRTVRLGEGLKASGRLSEAAMARTIAALRVCAGKVRRRRVSRLRAVATEACRRADNCAEFLTRAWRETGIELEIISSSEEANLALTGLRPLLDPASPHALIFDIGGGSTQVTWFQVGSDGAPDAAGRRAEAALLDWHSVPLGVVNLSEGYGGREIGLAAYREMVAEVRAALAPFEQSHGLAELAAGGRMQMLGTSGTVTTLTGLHKRLPRYDRAQVDGAHLSFETIRTLSERLAGMTYDERVRQPCIGHERADLVVAGCAILDAICRTWPVGRLRVADRGLREGILFNLIQHRAAEGRHRPAR